MDHEQQIAVNILDSIIRRVSDPVLRAKLEKIKLETLEENATWMNQNIDNQIRPTEEVHNSILKQQLKFLQEKLAKDGETYQAIQKAQP